MDAGARQTLDADTDDNVLQEHQQRRMSLVERMEAAHEDWLEF